MRAYTRPSLPLAAGYAWADGSTDAKQIEWSIAQAAGELVYNGKMLTGVAADVGYEIEGTDKAVNAGSYEARIILKDGYRWSDGDEASCKVVKWSIAKAKNPVKVKSKVRKIACKKLAKGKVTVKPIVVRNLAKQTKATFKKVKKGSARQAYKALKINKKTGKVTVRKGAKKGVCKLEVKVHVAATANYKAFSKVVRVKVRVK